MSATADPLVAFAVDSAREAYQKPTLESLIASARNSRSPMERECAVRAAYLMGGVNANEGRANAVYDGVKS